jgi:heme/copper-type cytochrome/quinol oxidase subunit 1
VTVVETAAPDASTAASATAEDVVRPTGLTGLLGTIDHIGLGRMWVLASLLFLLVAGAAGGLVGAERLDVSEVNFLDDAVPELFSLHATAGIFLFLVPAFIGVAMAVVPLQVGAATIAFPRAAAAAFWGWFLSGGVLVASYVIEGGPEGSDPDGILLFAVGLGGVLVSLCLGAVCVVTTVWTLRTAGMTLDRVPGLSWAMFVSGVVWLLTFPVLLAGVILLYLAVQYDAAVDAGSLLRWAFGPPAVFGYALPALGVVVDVIPVSAGVRQRNRGVVIGAVAAVGILSFGADLLVAGRDASITEDFLYVVGAFAMVLPFLAILGAVADTLRRGRLNPTSPLLFAVVSLLALLLGAVAAAVRSIDALDLVGTTADTAVVHLVLAGGAVGVIGALHFWPTKIFGTVFGERIGRTAAVLLLLGGVALAAPDLVSGFLDQPAGLVGGADVEDGVEALNLVSLAGGGIVLLGVLLVLVNLTGSVSRRPDDAVPDDPWGGHTLEWRTTSPPAPGGPGPLEPVTSAAPLLDWSDTETKEARA